jgi:nitroimidazol reductase NimA-like FMN-containing flavoprotein (pyridoxamine 5'-phosphate oxidase superfamily)
MRLLAVTAKEGGIGRIGVPTDQAPVVIPVNFAVHGNRILLRVGTGFLSLAASGRLVAFEVDHIDPATDTAWSVLVRGLATLEGHPTDEELAAVAHPYVPRPGHQVLSIRPDVTTGRQFTISGPT